MPPDTILALMEFVQSQKNDDVCVEVDERPATDRIGIGRESGSFDSDVSDPVELMDARARMWKCAKGGGVVDVHIDGCFRVYLS